MKFCHRDLRRFALSSLVSRELNKLCIGLCRSLRTREQCQRASDLMPLLTWQLWLAKDLGAPPGLSPGIDPFLNWLHWWVAQSMLPLFNHDWDSHFCSLLVSFHCAGWPSGKLRTPRCRYLVVKNGKGRFQKSPNFVS
jgi:hypothetical protein